MNYNFIFVGLGNIGEKYKNTRHNIGWMLIEKLSEKYNLNFSAGKGDYYFADLKLFGKNIMFVLPTTYMNNSGQAIKQVLNKTKLKPSDVCILVDEYNFPIGKIHLKAIGSDGGHNGISSVIYELETQEFMRLRLGIDKKFGPGELVNYVLSDFSEAEQKDLDIMLEKGVKAIEHLVKSGFQRSMSDINSGKIFKNGEDEYEKKEK